MDKMKKTGDVLAALLFASTIVLVCLNPWFFGITGVVYLALQEHRKNR